MQIYDYADYKRFLKAWIQAMPRNGHGQARRLAEHLGVNSVVVSQVLSGDRHFTEEQALRTGGFFGLDDRSTDYLVTLVSKERAGTHDLVKYYDDKLARIKAEVLQLKSQIVQFRELTETEKGVFYSNWYYSGVRLLSSIEQYDTIDAIANYFGLSRAKTARIAEFLVSCGLCVEDGGRIRMGPATTWVDNESALIDNHRRNWRIKAMERFKEPGPNDLFYAGPCSLAEEDIKEIRKELVALVKQVAARVNGSKAERVACLNIDWFEF